MSLFNFPFDAIDRTHLEILIENGVPEDTRLDFKRDAYGRSDDEKREFLKDITALANTEGGHLIIGMEEKDGAAHKLVPLTVSEDNEIARLENLIADRVKPRISRIRIKSVAVENGYVLLARVGRSADRPHGFIVNEHHRFYGRASRRVYALDMKQLGGLFMSGRTMRQDAIKFRDERLSAIQVQATPTALDMENQCVFILHIIPIDALNNPTVIDVEKAYEEAGLLLPMGGGGNAKINYNGVCMEGGADRSRYTQLFGSGIIESVRADLPASDEQGSAEKHHLRIAKGIDETFSNYLRALNRLGVFPPFLVMCSLFDTTMDAKTKLTSAGRFNYAGAIDAHNHLFSPVEINEYTDNNAAYMEALRPIFDVLAHGAGQRRSDLYDKNGGWIGASDI